MSYHDLLLALTDGWLDLVQATSLLELREAFHLAAALCPDIDCVLGELARLLAQVFPQHRLLVLLNDPLEAAPGMTWFFHHGRQARDAPPEEMLDLAHELWTRQRGCRRPFIQPDRLPVERGTLASAIYGPDREQVLGALVLAGSHPDAPPDKEAYLHLDVLADALGRWTRVWRYKSQCNTIEAQVFMARRLKHELNNLLAGLFPNVEYATDTLELWARLYPNLEKLVRGGLEVPSLRAHAREIRQIEEPSRLRSRCLDTSELLRDLDCSRQRCQNMVKRLDEFICRSRGLLTELSLVELVRGVIGKVKQERDACPKVTLRGDEGIRVFAYRHLLERCLRELLLNAMEASEKEDGSVDVIVEQGEQEILVQIRDTGAGMSAAELEAAQMPFAARGSRRVSDGPSRGLGLNIALHTALKLGGDLVLRSRPGNGTVATLRLLDPTVSGRLILLLGDAPQQVLSVLEAAELLHVLEGTDPCELLGGRAPDLVLLHESYPIELAFDLVNELESSFPGIPLLRYRCLGADQECQGEADAELDRRTVAEVQSPKELLGELRRLLASQKASRAAFSSDRSTTLPALNTYRDPKE